MSILRGPADVHFAIWHGFTPVLLLSVLTFALIAAAYPARAVFRRLASGRLPGPERLYEGTLGALDAISRAIGPPLHAASLRSYVLATAVTVAACLAGALAVGGDIGSFTIATDVRLHEVLIVGVIVAAALSAARATSSMSAVLSLGTVGYGVALLFVSFGAPDLAMTQFSVETLTVVIFVLVFRHFPRFGVLSPGLVRLRDGLVAVVLGTLVAALVLFVGTSGTPSRLAGFFVENSVPLAHGRNIVNVILVDFRAFDTLGEITVLVTAAIGVLAALRMAGTGSAGWNLPGHASPAPATSAILRAGARTLMPLLLLFAVFLLLRGHHEPGGGFVGGLVVAAAFCLYMVAYGVPAARRALIASPGTLLGVGLAVALASGLPSLVRQQPFLTAWWSKGALAVGTPLVFDVGVFLVVIGVVLTMTFNLAEED
jgi:multicomponent Na+:H+ antiporter subunit A